MGYQTAAAFNEFYVEWIAAERTGFYEFL